VQYRIGAPPPDQVWQQQKDDGDLRLLSILHYVYAALVGFGALFSILYVVIGIVMATTVASQGSSPSDQQAGMVVGAFFVVIGAFVLLLLTTKAVLMVLAGRGLASRRRYTLAFVAACICCINIPLGTALGIFTIIVLQRPSVKAAFGQRVG
jgi:hypothetical protein